MIQLGSHVKKEMWDVSIANRCQDSTTGRMVQTILEEDFEYENTMSIGQIIVIAVTALGAVAGLSCFLKACYHSFHPEDDAYPKSASVMQPRPPSYLPIARAPAQWPK